MNGAEVVSEDVLEVAEAKNPQSRTDGNKLPLPLPLLWLLFPFENILIHPATWIVGMQSALQTALQPEASAGFEKPTQPGRDSKPLHSECRHGACCGVEKGGEHHLRVSNSLS